MANDVMRASLRKIESKYEVIRTKYNPGDIVVFAQSPTRCNFTVIKPDGTFIWKWPWIDCTIVRAGHYATKDGCWAIVSEGHTYVDGKWRDTSETPCWIILHNQNGGLREDYTLGKKLGSFDSKAAAVKASTAFMEECS